MTVPLRVGVVGLGMIAPFYLTAIDRSPDLGLAAVCDVDETVLAPFRGSARHLSGGRVSCHRDHRELLRAAAVDAVVVTVPNDVHFEVCSDVLAAGLPVCVEKPLATTMSDAEALVRCAHDRDVALFTAFHRRYNAEVLALAATVASSGVPVESVTIRYLERIEEHIGRDRWYLDPARTGGGCVADNGPNAYNLAQLLVGPVQVDKVDTTRDAHGVDRHALVLLRAGSGTAVRVELDWSYPGECKDVRMCLVDSSVHRADMLRGHPGFKDSLWHEYVGIMTDFTKAVRTGGTVTDGGLPALHLVHETYRVEGEMP